MRDLSLCRTNNELVVKMSGCCAWVMSVREIFEKENKKLLSNQIVMIWTKHKMKSCEHSTASDDQMNSTRRVASKKEVGQREFIAH